MPSVKRCQAFMVPAKESTDETLQAALKAVGIDLQFLNWFPSKDGIPELVVGFKASGREGEYTNEVDNLGCLLCRGHYFSFSSLF